jgi:hypothetical protein
MRFWVENAADGRQDPRMGQEDTTSEKNILA